MSFLKRFSLVAVICLLLLTVVSCGGVTEKYADKINEAAAAKEYIEYEDVCKKIGEKNLIDFTAEVASIRGGVVIGVKGLLPRSIWLKKNFKTPSPKKAKITIETKGVEIRNKTYIQINKQSDTYYNPKTGWICIGEYKTYSIDDVIEFVTNGYLVLRDNKIVSFWLYVGENLPLM